MLFDDILKLIPETVPALEILFVSQNIKPVCRIEIGEELIEKLKLICSEHNLHLIEADFKFVQTEDGKALMMPLSSSMQGSLFVYISRSAQRAQDAKEAELNLDHEMFGRLLGYPECCIRFFIDNYEKAASMHDDYTLLTLPNSDSFDWRLNISLNFFDYRLISHFPHSFNCRASIEQTNKMLEVIKQNHPSLAAQIESRLKTVVIYSNHTGVHVLVNPRIENNFIYYDGVRLTSPNPTHNLLKKANKIEIISQNHLKLFKDNVLIEELKGEIGMLDFL